jgi:hypothetical protein
MRLPEADMIARSGHVCTGAALCRFCAAEYLSIGVDLFDEEARKTLPVIRIGRRVAFRRAALDAWLLARQETPCRPGTSTHASTRPSFTATSRSPASSSDDRLASEIERELMSPPRGSTSRRTAARVYPFPTESKPHD